MCVCVCAETQEERKRDIEANFLGQRINTFIYSSVSLRGQDSCANAVTFEPATHEQTLLYGRW